MNNSILFMNEARKIIIKNDCEQIEVTNAVPNGFVDNNFTCSAFISSTMTEITSVYFTFAKQVMDFDNNVSGIW